MDHVAVRKERAALKSEAQRSAPDRADGFCHRHLQIRALPGHKDFGTLQYGDFHLSGIVQ